MTKNLVACTSGKRVGCFYHRVELWRPLRLATSVFAAATIGTEAISVRSSRSSSRLSFETISCSRQIFAASGAVAFTDAEIHPENPFFPASDK